MSLKCCLFVCVGGTSRNITSQQLQTLSSLFCFTSLSLCYLNTMNQGVEHTCQCIRQFSLYISPHRQLQCLHHLFQSVSHLSQLTVPPVPSHRKWGIRISHGGVWKGHLFHRCRWRSSWRSNVGLEWKTTEENYERIAGGLELRLFRRAGQRHRAAVFSHNMSSAVPPIAWSALSLRLAHMFFHDIFKGDIPKCTTPLPILRVILPDTNISTDMWSALNNNSHSQLVWQARGERDPCTIAHYFHQIVRFHENK